jgi:hypothetical protein
MLPIGRQLLFAAGRGASLIYRADVQSTAAHAFVCGAIYGIVHCLGLKILKVLGSQRTPLPPNNLLSYCFIVSKLNYSLCGPQISPQIHPQSQLPHARPECLRRTIFELLFRALIAPFGLCPVPLGTYGTHGTTGLSGLEQPMMFQVAVPEQPALFQVFQVFRPEHRASLQRVLRQSQAASAAPSKIAPVTT